MNTYELMPLLIKAALENDRKTLESVAIMISKKVKSEHPEISKEIVRSLTLDTSTMRAVGNQPIPVDKESRYELADVKFVTETAPPILEAHTYKQLNDFLQERTLINELIEQDILPPNSILLFGAPGVGKTYIANWIAQQLNLPIITLNLASSISSYLGRTGQNIHNVFLRFLLSGMMMHLQTVTILREVKQVPVFSYILYLHLIYILSRLLPLFRMMYGEV